MEEQLAVECEKLIFAIRQIVNNWERGDLAAAVNEARECADEVEDFIVNHVHEGRPAHAFQAVQITHGREQILDTFRVTKTQTADDAYHAAEELCVRARRLPFRPAAFVREIGAE